MPYYDEGFYGEPTGFDMFIDEAKEKLAASIKQSHIDELERLRQENRDLQGVKADWARIEAEHKARMAELDRREEGMARKRLLDVLEGLATPYWEAVAECFPKPKCGLCDGDRRIYYTRPNGTEAYDTCHVCGGSDWLYHPRQLEMNAVKVTRNGKAEEYTIRPCEEYDVVTGIENDWYCTYDPALTPEENEEARKASGISGRRFRFRSEEDCRAWCGWKNGGKGIPAKDKEE